MSIINSLNNLYKNSVRWANSNLSEINIHEIDEVTAIDLEHVTWSHLIGDIVSNIKEVIFTEGGKAYTGYDMINEFRTCDGWSITTASTIKPFINTYCKVFLDDDKKLCLERVSREFAKAISNFYKLTTAEFLSVLYTSSTRNNDRSVEILKGILPLVSICAALDTQVLTGIVDAFSYNLKSFSMGRIPPISDEEAAGIILELGRFGEDEENSLFRDILSKGVHDRIIRQDVYDFLKSYALKAYKGLVQDINSKN